VDFSRDQTQDAVAEVAAGLLERGGGKPTGEIWTSFVAADLTTLALPGRLGGAELGLPAIATLLTEIGRAAAQLPALATFGLGVLPLLELADGTEHDALLELVGKGAVLTAALSEPGSPFTLRPATTAVAEGDLLIVDGLKVGVPYADRAEAILVPTDAGVVLVDPSADGVTLTPTPTSTGEPEFAVRFDEVRVPNAALLHGDLVALHRIALACIGALCDGLLSGATQLTASHVGTRHQFGKPLATFQAVAQEIADVYVISRTLHVAALSAVWRLGEGLDAASDLDVVAYWIAAEVPKAMQVCHHLHGGIGVDVSYPMHRYSSQVKDLARMVGGTSHRLDLLGARCTSI